jgi:peptide/nickel transport system ATP-binding protein
MALLEVNNLDVTLATSRGPARAVRNLSFDLDRGQTLGIVGESGCGKSMTALALLGLLPENGVTTGSINLGGQDLLALDEDAMCGVRGNRISMIFQEPMTSLNPLHTIGRQVTEPMLIHQGMTRDEARAEAVRLLERVGIASAAQRLDNFPHQLSGGQRQRVMIAMALSCKPDVLIADEPTTALDVTIQGQILDLIADLVSESGMSLILISHDLGVIAETVDRVLVMYGGAGVETGPTASLFEHLAHPYTQGLFSAVPKLGSGGKGKTRTRLSTIPGLVPELADLPPGCTFADRCDLADEKCAGTLPTVHDVANDGSHRLACLKPDEAKNRLARAGADA